MSFFDTLRNSIESKLKISNCSFCSVAQTETGICEDCIAAIDTIETACCRCASQLQADSNHQTEQGVSHKAECGRCLSKPPVYHKVVAATRYHYPVDKALSELKFNKQLHYARSLSHLLERKVKHHYRSSPYPDAIVAIPLHPKRLKERGFNQSNIIARQLSKALGIPQTSALTRVKDTPHQIGLSEKQRKSNLNNAFRLEQNLPQHIALVDDVVTTGSTITEATKLCLKQGVKQVDVWCLAKT